MFNVKNMLKSNKWEDTAGPAMMGTAGPTPAFIVLDLVPNQEFLLIITINPTVYTHQIDFNGIKP